jgi:signal transduction histidine kinase
MVLSTPEQRQIIGASLRIETMPDVVTLRTRVSRFFVGLLWLHVPLIAAMAVYNNTSLIAQLLVAVALAATATFAVWIAPATLASRMTVALALTGMPILIVYNGTGPWQIDYHMYFFAVFAMLVAYCDWRPIVASASLTAVHHYVFDIVDPSRVFPSDGGLARVALHAGIVAVECGVLIWVTIQLRHLFREFAISRQIAENAEERATGYAAELEAKNRELDSFAYTVAHDLRAPLRAINEYSSALKEDFPAELPPEAERSLARIGANARQMLKLIDSLLNFSRLGAQKLILENLSPKEVALSALERLRATADGRVEVAMSELPRCSADPVLLGVVYQNLLENALKFTRNSETPKIDVGWMPAPEPAGAAVYYVRDNGAGFDMRYSDKLFGVFSRLHRADQFPGTGAGLAIVKRIVVKHGGRIWAEAQLGIGATFFFTLEPGL